MSGPSTVKLPPIILPANKANFHSETTFFNVDGPDGRTYSVYPEDWRQGWTKEGKPIEDGLPVLRMIIKAMNNWEYVVRPYHLIDDKGQSKFAGSSAIREVRFISPKAASLMNFKVRDVDQEKLELTKERVFKEYTLVPIFQQCFGAPRKISNPPKPYEKAGEEEKKS